MLTIVTSLIDIGRGDWNTKHRRSIEEYISNFSNVCKLENNMVIWTTSELEPKIRELRKGRENTTDIQIISIQDCRLYSRKQEIGEIMARNRTRVYYHENACDAPEFTSTEYVIVVNNKVDFMERTAKLYPLTKYLVWVDAGYSCGTYDMIDKSVRIPDSSYQNSIYICKLWEYWFNRDPLEFQNQWPLDVVDGGFVCISQEMIMGFAKEYYTLVDQLLDKGIVDDDQFFMTMLYVKQPDLFSLEPGKWFGGCKFIQ